MIKTEFLSAEGRAKLEAELVQLVGPGREGVAARIKEAIGFGDISENSEYDTAKNEQALLEGRILVVQDLLRRAVPLPHAERQKGKVGVGSTVSVEDEWGPAQYTITGSTESNAKEGRISPHSPLGKALIGLSEGELALVKAPNGERKVRVVRVL